MKTFIKEFVMKHPVIALGGVAICAKTIKKCVYAITNYQGSKDSIFSFDFNLNVPEKVAEEIEKKAVENQAETVAVPCSEEEKSDISDDDATDVTDDGTFVESSKIKSATTTSNLCYDDIQHLTDLFESWKKNHTVDNNGFIRVVNKENDDD